MKKHMKLFAAVLALCMTFALASPCAAAEAGEKYAAEGRGALAENNLRAGSSDGTELYVPGEADGEAQFDSLADGAALDSRRVECLPDAEFVEGELLVKYLPQSMKLQANGDFFGVRITDSEFLFSVPQESEGGAVLQSADEASWVKISLGEADMLSAWNKLLESDRILAVEPNYIYHADAIASDATSDPFTDAQDWLTSMNAWSGWSRITAGSEIPGVNGVNPVVVAVVDTGVDYDHPDLAENMWSNGEIYGYNAATGGTGQSDIDDDAGHGTHVAGIIAAAKNGIGVTGVAYGAKIMPVKVLGEDGSGSNADVVKGIDWAATNGAQIINMSLGGYGNSQSLQDSCNNAKAAGVFVVVAAGNESLPTCYAGDSYFGGYACPANCNGVFTVMAMDTTASSGDLLAGFSNYDADPNAGSEYEIMAPGTKILSTYPGGQYQYLQGTSMACPTVAGAAAVLLGLGCSYDELWEILANSGEVKQGKTLTYKVGEKTEVNTLFYNTLDLDKAVAAATTKTKFYSYLRGKIFFSSPDYGVADGRAVRIDGKLAAGLSIELTAKDSTAYNVTVTGTIGGKSIDASKTTVAVLKPDEIVSVALPLSGGDNEVNWRIDENGKPTCECNITVSATDAASDNISFDIDYFAPVVDMSVPEGITYNATSGKYEVTAAEALTVNNIYLEHDLCVPSGKTVTLKGIVYLKDGVSISADADGTLSFNSATVFGEGLAKISGDGTNVSFLGCSVYDPDITGAKSANGTRFMPEHSAETPKKVEAAAINASGIINLTNLTVTADSFNFSMVNRCRDTELTLGSFTYNSFVDNFTYQGTTDDSLKIYSSDATASAGGRNNCFVGPSAVYKSDTTPASVINAYYQAVNGSKTTVTPKDVQDELICGAASQNVISDVAAFKTTDYSNMCPVFMLSSSVNSFGRTAKGSTGYAVDFQLSGNIKQEADGEYTRPASSVYCSSITDALRNGMDVWGYCTSADDSITMYGEKQTTKAVSTEYYSISGFFAADRTIQTTPTTQLIYNFTALYYQSQFNNPLVFDYYDYDELCMSIGLSASKVDSGIMLSLDAKDVYSKVGYVKILRSIDGGTSEAITQGTLAGFSSGSYIDTAASDAGHLYSYTIELYKDSSCARKYQTGSASLYLETGNGKVLTDGKNTSLTASDIVVSNSERRYFSSISFDVVCPTGVTASDIVLSDAVKALGLPVSVRQVSGSQPTYRVFIGPGAGTYLLGEGVVATISLANATEADGTVEIKNLTLSGYDAGKIANYRLKADSTAKLLVNAAGEDACAWSAATEQPSIFASAYKDSRMVGTKQLAQGENDLSGMYAKAGATGSLKVFFLGANNAPTKENWAFTANAA